MPYASRIILPTNISQPLEILRAVAKEDILFRRRIVLVEERMTQVLRVGRVIGASDDSASHGHYGVVVLDAGPRKGELQDWRSRRKFG